LPGSLHTFNSIIFFLIGLCFGSFLNVIVYRLPQGLSLVKPPSQCPSCHFRLGFIDLIPVIGYLLLRGRCRKCRVKISLRYPLVELATGLLFLLLFYRFGLSADYFFYLTLLFTLLAISLIDLDYRIVPNGLVAFGLIAGLIFYLIKLSDLYINLPSCLLVDRNLADAFWGFLLGGGIILAIFLISRGGMGAGDVKLMAMIGLYAGLQGTIVTLFLGFIFGALVGIIYMILGKLTRKDALPFAPFLSLGALVTVLWGTQIWNWYTNLLR
jgi:leader peptidase (prepilin peptidase) / N-methyltransferase